MTRAALGLFLLTSAGGTMFLLLFFPSRALGKGFLVLHGFVGTFFIVLALLLRPAGLPAAVVAATAGVAAVATVVSRAGGVSLARPLLLAAAAGAEYAAVRVALVAPRLPGGTWTAASALLGGLFFGCVVLVMNLGHWYLVSRSLPFQLLARGAALFAGLAILRALLLGAAVAANPQPEGLQALLSLDRDALFFLFRVVWGIVGPLALSWFIWRTAEMKSNQAATGLLYVALVFVLIGELLASYLTVATGFPA